MKTEIYCPLGKWITKRFFLPRFSSIYSKTQFWPGCFMHCVALENETYRNLALECCNKGKKLGSTESSTKGSSHKGIWGDMPHRKFWNLQVWKFYAISSILQELFVIYTYCFLHCLRNLSNTDWKKNWKKKDSLQSKCKKLIKDLQIWIGEMDTNRYSAESCVIGVGDIMHVCFNLWSKNLGGCSPCYGTVSM